MQFGAVSEAPHSFTLDATSVAPVAAESFDNGAIAWAAPFAPVEESAVAAGGGITVGV